MDDLFHLKWIHILLYFIVMYMSWEMKVIYEMWTVKFFWTSELSSRLYYCQKLWCQCSDDISQKNSFAIESLTFVASLPPRAPHWVWRAGSPEARLPSPRKSSTRSRWKGSRWRSRCSSIFFRSFFMIYNKQGWLCCNQRTCHGGGSRKKWQPRPKGFSTTRKDFSLQ